MLKETLLIEDQGEGHSLEKPEADVAAVDSNHRRRDSENPLLTWQPERPGDRIAHRQRVRRGYQQVNPAFR